METVYSSTTAAVSTPDVWQQLSEIQFGAALTKLFDYVAFVPIMWEASTTIVDTHSVETSTPYSEPNNRQYGQAGTARETFVRPPRVVSRSSIGVVPTNPGTQLFGLFVSPYFLFSIFIGFVISRIHVLVHRQRVRPIGVLARVALYAPAYILLLRAIALNCVALSGSTVRHHVHAWMQTPVDFVSKTVHQYGIVARDEPIAASRALWLSFLTCCVFDCIDVFVARLEGSPCAPYEYIGGLIERTSLYYFYGGSYRIQELGLLDVLEKLLLSHMFMVFESGWRWRFVPTGIANVLMLHHFLFSVRNYTGSHSVYPFVQVMSMALLGVSLVIVATTVLIRWLAITVDRLGMKSVRDVRRGGTTDMRDAANTAIYDRNGVFQGTGADEMNDNDEMFELTRNTFIPVVPDLRRDFSVEILDLAGTCLQQCSKRIQMNGFSRSFDAMRLPKTTALDQYVDSVVRANAASRDAERKVGRRTQRQQTSHRAMSISGLGVLIDDEPDAFEQIPGNSSDEDEDDDFDYVSSSEETSSFSDNDNDDDAVDIDHMSNEATDLMDDILSNTDESDNGSLLASVSTFIAHSLFNGDDAQTAQQGMMTRRVYRKGLERDRSPSKQQHLSAPLLFKALATMFRAIPSAAAYNRPALPFERHENEALADLILNRRPPPHDTATMGPDTTANVAGGSNSQSGGSSDSGILCVVCWVNTRCVMLRPCRCLCMCNDCRTALAARNFAHCPCCRRDVAGYSRVYAV
ncbi:hypothetical protein EV175_000434 [Coemansia sp. RSA 1933]|nr:hypothetical protein EV175_000434 [Coemansia sp. RSA 1933]